MVRRYLTLTVPPILLVEILGDLSKQFKTGTPPDQVRSLAQKIVPICSTVNLSYRALIEAEVDGEAVPMEGRPIVGSGKAVTAANGETGLICEESPQEKALIRWQDGEFDTAEAETARLWREQFKARTLEEGQKWARAQYPGLPTCGKMEEVSAAVDKILEGEDVGTLVEWFLWDSGGQPGFVSDVKKRVVSLPRGGLKVSAPFTHHCVRTSLIFHVGMLTTVLGTKESNKADVGYLFYAPFSHAFSSGDRFLIEMACGVLSPSTAFVSQPDLKRSLGALANWWAGLTDEEKSKEEELVGPPENPDCVIHQLWRKTMKPDYRTRRHLKLSPERRKDLLKHVMSLVDARASGGKIKLGEQDGVDFVARRRVVRLDGPCICGSDKLFRDCHWKGR